LVIRIFKSCMSVSSRSGRRADVAKQFENDIFVLSPNFVLNQRLVSQVAGLFSVSYIITE
jgi:hypothetical protein